MPINYMEFTPTEKGGVRMIHIATQNYQGYVPDFVMKGII